MSGFPSITGQGGRCEAIGADTSISGLTQITLGGTANTKTGYTQLVASTSFDIHYLVVEIDFINSSAVSLLDVSVDIAIGAASSEVVIIADLLATLNRNQQACFQLPVFIPAGSRVSARAQSDQINEAIGVGIKGFSRNSLTSPGYGRVTTYGFNSSDTGGVSIDAGATLNTKGAYSQIIASTTYDIKGLVMAPSLGGNRSSSDTAVFLYDIAVGAGGSEAVIVPDIPYSSDSDEKPTANLCFFPVEIPAGSRVAVRSQSSTNDATDRITDVVIYGVG